MISGMERWRALWIRGLASRAFYWAVLVVLLASMGVYGKECSSS